MVEWPEKAPVFCENAEKFLAIGVSPTICGCFPTILVADKGCSRSVLVSGSGRNALDVAF